MIFDIGLTDYEASYRLQKELVFRRKLGLIGDSVIITEHRAVFTIGRAVRTEKPLACEAFLKAHDLKVLNVDRGGDITFHGPGQLVLYPIIDLKARSRDLHRYLRDLESVVMTFLNKYGMIAERVPGKTGVWIGLRKIASLGIGASDWVTYHGVSVNIDVDLSYFSMIHPCGMVGVKMTSLSEVMGIRIGTHQVRNTLLSCFRREFNVEEDNCPVAGNVSHCEEGFSPTKQSLFEIASPSLCSGSQRLR